MTAVYIVIVGNEVTKNQKQHEVRQSKENLLTNRKEVPSKLKEAGPPPRKESGSVNSTELENLGKTSEIAR